VQAVRQAEDILALRSTKLTSQHQKVSVGPPKITRFEKARIVGARALQISMGAPILIEVDTQLSSPIQIALKELDEGILPMTVRRTLPSGAFQDIPLKWLLTET
jgi:DNA-directed RNA polymerase subunit K/omega